MNATHLILFVWFELVRRVVRVPPGGSASFCPDINRDRSSRSYPCHMDECEPMLGVQIIRFNFLLFVKAS